MIALILICLFFPLAGHAATTGSPAPSFVLNDIAGNRFSSSDYTGKVLIVGFWSPWCVPCRDELPALEGLYARYRKEGLEVVAVSVESSKEAVSAFLRKSKLTFPVLLDENKRVSDRFDCTHLPTTIIIGRDGIVRKTHKGYGKDVLHEYEQTIVELVRQK
jgi:peroxiredoxin